MCINRFLCYSYELPVKIDQRAGLIATEHIIENIPIVYTFVAKFSWRQQSCRQIFFLELRIESW